MTKWTGVQWTVGTVIAAAAVIAALGGPEDAWLKTEASIRGHPPPKIVSVELAPGGPKGSYIATMRNPALEDVLITGYRATPQNLGISGDDSAFENVSLAATAEGAVTVMSAEEQRPETCEAERFVSLPRPLVIEARGARALRVRPWKEPCVFTITLLSDHGETEPSLGISGFRP